MPKSLLKVSELTVHFGGSARAAIESVSFDLNAGEIVALLGESGAGKTTLGRALAAVLPTSARVSGKVHFPRSAEKARPQVSLIPQDLELTLNPFLRLRDQLSDVVRAHRPRKPHQECAIQISQLLELAGLPSDLGASYSHQLSGGERQRAVIALALGSQPDLLIADEPTSALDSATQAETLRALKHLVNGSNCSLLLITHDPTLLESFADRILVMHEGQIVEQGSCEAVLKAPRHPFTRRLMNSILPLPAYRPAPPSRYPVVPVLEARGLCKTYGEDGLRFPGARTTHAVTNVSLRLGTGRSLALVGRSGAGKSTLARCLALLEQPDNGEVFCQGRPLSMRRSGELRNIRPDIQMVWQHSALALNPRFRALDLIAEPLLASGRALKAHAFEKARSMMALVNLPQTLEAHRPQQLSGGQRQRVAFARALILSPAVLILDEPFAGLDLPLQKEMIELLLHLKMSFSLSCLFITHNLRTASFICDEIAVLQNGNIVETGDPGKVFCNSETVAARELAEAAGFR